MDKIVDNIIAIRKRDISKANEAFADFMSLTEKCLNDKVKNDHKLYKDCGGKKMESVALNALHEVAPQTPFRPEEIKLVSGAKFPDIQAEQYYGVEVKTTASNTWKSVGSSIVESTRIEDVSMIYMLFAKLGGDFAEFRCKPYEDCLDNISLTHQPRYQIDMELEEKKRENIFQKMKIDYNTFRILEEKDKIQKVKRYFRSIAKEGKEMQWWIGDEDSETSVPMTIRFLNDLAPEEKKQITVRMFILFPELFSNQGSDRQTKYKRASLWLCSRQSLICSNIRDFFTSGGKVIDIGSTHFNIKMPQILKRLYDCRNDVSELLSHPDEALVVDISELWTIGCNPIYYKDCWMSMTQNVFKENLELKNIKIEDLFDKW